MNIPTQLPPEIFRSYDIRGIVPSVLNENISYAVGLALGSCAQEQQQPTLVVGRDHRVSSAGLSHALCQGLLDAGINVIDIGQVPTPVLYFATYFFKTQSGVMVTGSHCAPEYNGLKMVLAGKSVADAAIQDLALRIKTQRFSRGQGHYQQKNGTEAYLSALLSRVAPLEKRKKIVIDAGHGMMGELAPRVFSRMNCEVLPLYCDIDSHFPHHHPDPSQPENLRDLIAAVALHQADLGIAFDGDGDRIGVVTSEGEIIWPDRLLAAYAQALLKEVPGATVIYDVKCTRHLGPWIESCGGKPLLWKTGHSHIKTKMQETAALLAGEMSGHLFFAHNWYGFDDALFAAVQLVNILAQQALTSHLFFQQIPSSVITPELKLPMSEETKFSFIEKFISKSVFEQGDKCVIDGLRVDYPDGFGLVRASNTSPYLILRFEGDTEAALTRIQTAFKKNLLALDATLNLPF
ncbi:MAG: phosphomannomutase/phosphoglucomutase [Gammaproteobacteria bacterium]|nr:phosphomannomutase/phosphoglucomutase [Gammaproteobacteria bacterium]